MIAAKAPTSDQAVKAKTGRDWAECCAVLDAAGAAAMSHTDIAAHVAAKHGVSGWWAQSVAPGYERLRGRRQTHETSAGFQATASRTLAVPVARLYAAWAEAGQRAAWLGPVAHEVTTATPPKSLRIAWADGSRVAVYLLPKGKARSQVAIGHEKLKDADAVAGKSFWKGALSRLKDWLEA